MIEIDLDDRGRETHRRVTTLAGGFDGAVRRISTTYNDLGRRQLVTQYDNAAVGSGSVVDEVKYTYDDWAEISAFEQDRNSAVGASGSVDDYSVTYTWEKATGGRNTIRLGSMRLPDNALMNFDYRSVGGRHDDDVSRVTRISEATTPLVVYRYVGVGDVVSTSYLEPDVLWEQADSGTEGYYPDRDRFDRITSSRWTKDTGGGDVDFYDVDITYDRNSNITQVLDNVHTGFDVIYTIDGLDRLIRAQEGTESSGSITSETRDQIWTLDPLGNWDQVAFELGGVGQYDDDRTHNDVNELTARDTDDDGNDDYTLSYDAVGNMTDDGEDYEYEWDAFGRLRKVSDTGDQSLVAEYRYNGLGYRISVHEDTDTDGDVDGNDKWFHHAYDVRWRVVGTFREDDTDPKEQFVYQNAGLSGRGGSSYIDLVAYRDKDADTAWTTTSDGALEERLYYCQNWRADVSALVNDTGNRLIEWVKYLSYGAPFGLPAGDADSDGDADSADETQIQAWSGSSYDVRGDVNLDGTVDSSDVTVFQSELDGAGLGLDALSVVGNRAGYTGHRHGVVSTHGRARNLKHDLGRWLRRDPAGYSDGLLLYGYVKGSPIQFVDSLGMAARIPAVGTTVGPQVLPDGLLPNASYFPSPPGAVVLVLPQGPSPAAAGGVVTVEPADPHQFGLITVVIVDGRNNCTRPEDSACLDYGESSDGDHGIEDADLLYVCGDIECCEFRIFNGWTATVNMDLGYVQFHRPEGRFTRPPPRVKCETKGPGSPIWKGLQGPLQECADGNRPFSCPP